MLYQVQKKKMMGKTSMSLSSWSMEFRGGVQSMGIQPSI